MMGPKGRTENMREKKQKKKDRLKKHKIKTFQHRRLQIKNNTQLEPKGRKKGMKKYINKILIKENFPKKTESGGF